MPISLINVGLTIFPNIGGIVNAILNKREKIDWYEVIITIIFFYQTHYHLYLYQKKVNKPSWRPPNWVFGPVWTALYTAMGYSSYLIYRDSDGPTRKLALSIYAFQLGLNWLWPPLFFQFHKMGLVKSIKVLLGLF